MHRRLGRDVVERQRVVVLVDLSQAARRGRSWRTRSRRHTPSAFPSLRARFSASRTRLAPGKLGPDVFGRDAGLAQPPAGGRGGRRSPVTTSARRPAPWRSRSPPPPRPASGRSSPVRARTGARCRLLRIGAPARLDRRVEPLEGRAVAGFRHAPCNSRSSVRGHGRTGTPARAHVGLGLGDRVGAEMEDRGGEHAGRAALRTPATRWSSVPTPPTRSPAPEPRRRSAGSGRMSNPSPVRRGPSRSAGSRPRRSRSCAAPRPRRRCPSRGARHG